MGAGSRRRCRRGTPGARRHLRRWSGSDWHQSHDTEKERKKREEEPEQAAFKPKPVPVAEELLPRYSVGLVGKG